MKKEELEGIAIECISILAADYELHTQDSFADYDNEGLWVEVMKETGNRMQAKNKEIFKLIFPKGIPNKIAKAWHDQEYKTFRCIHCEVEISSEEDNDNLGLCNSCYRLGRL